MKTLISVAACLVLAACMGCSRGCKGCARKPVPAWTQARNVRPNPRQFLVHFKPGTGATLIKTLLGRAQVIRRYSVFTDLYAIEFPKGVPVELNVLTKNAESVDANHLYFADTLPNDPNFGEQWALDNTGQNGGKPDADINAPEVWEHTTDSGTAVIAVLDSGVDYEHADLKPNIWTNPGEIPGNNIDDDGNGYIDDVHGVNVMKGIDDKDSGNPMDDSDHGTWVAGIIGAVGNNSTLLSGVLWHTKILACKMLDNSGVGDEVSAIACLDYVAALHIKGIPITVINASWGSPSASSALKFAIEELQKLGVLYVTAAGNDGLDLDNNPSYPSSYSLLNVLSVGATDSSDQWAPYSNYGRHTVDLMAPGDDILTLKRGGGLTAPRRSGTSFAAPYVSAVAALLQANQPTLGWVAVRNLLLSGGDSVFGAHRTISGRRVRAWDNNGQGSLTCTSGALEARLLPAQDFVEVSAGGQLLLAALNIHCATPNGVLTVSGPGGTSITLHDDATGGDQIAGDGLYSATWTAPLVKKQYVLTFPGADDVTVEVH
jgi:subtilisin family serine protease